MNETPGDKWRENRLTWKIVGRLPYGLSLPTVRSTIYHAFKVWSYPASNLEFSEVLPNGDAHFTIRFVSGDHGDGYSFDGRGRTIAHAFYPRSGQIHFDDDELWTAPQKFLDQNERYHHGFYYDSTNLLAVAAHEIGHALGLSHDNANRMSIMYPYYSPEHDEPKLAPKDIKLLRYLYGPCDTADIDRSGNRGTATNRPATKRHRFHTRYHQRWGK